MKTFLAFLISVLLITSARVANAAVSSNSLIKLSCPAGAAVDDPCKAVYYYGSDGKRHAFPNDKVYFTWYSDFSTVQTISSSEMASFSLGTNVTYRPGVKMVKFASLAKVYAVSRNGLLRWVSTEDIARLLYGTSWNQQVHDVSDTFFTNYTFGTDITSSTDFKPTTETATATSINVDKGLATGALGSSIDFRIDSRQMKPISRFIYGMNTDNLLGWVFGEDEDYRDLSLNTAFERLGGNVWTAYNWEINGTNLGADFNHQNDDIFNGGPLPGKDILDLVTAARTKGQAALVTVPIHSNVAADKNEDGDVAKTPNYLSKRFRISVAKKNAPFALSPDLGDAYVYQDEFVNFLKVKFPDAFKAGSINPIFFALDNEPDLWFETHARIHPSPVTYEELRQKTIDYATAIKGVTPETLIFAPVNYGWYGMTALQGAPDGNNQDFQSWFLARMREAEGAAGKRLVDVLDFHWYPDAPGTGVADTAKDNSATIVAERVQLPRSLWDPTYTEKSWIPDSLGGPIRLLPRIQAKIDANYPGTKMAITEYSYGGVNHISGAIAQADALGIFGREGVFAANAHLLWGVTNNPFVLAAFKLYRNYDGANSSFGNTSVEARTSDDSKSSVYASIDAGNPNRMVVVAINKTSGMLKATISMTHTVPFVMAEVWQLKGASPTIERLGDIPIGDGNVFDYEMPAMSATTFVLKH